MLRNLFRPKAALRSLLFLCIFTTAVSAFAQDEFLEIEQSDIPGLAGMYEIPGDPPQLMVMIKNPEQAGVEISASALSTQSLDIDLPTPTEVVEIYNEGTGPEFGDAYPKSPDGTLTTQSATEAVQYRFVNYSITELYTWRDVITDELPQTVDWVSGAGIEPVNNRVLLVVDTREADFGVVREEVEVFLKAHDIPREAVRLVEGYSGDDISFGSGSSGGGSSSRDNLQDEVRPLVAGLEIGVPGGGCTLGWFARSGRDYGFVTAYHCLQLASGRSTEITQDRRGRRVATVNEEYELENTAPYDVVFAEMPGTNFREEVAWPATNGTLSYSSTRSLLGVASERYLINSVLYLVGKNSGRKLSGGLSNGDLIDYKNVVTGLIISCTRNYVAQTGDSGGPWILVRNNRYYLAGIHQGWLRYDRVKRSCFTTASDAQRHLDISFLF